MSKENLFLTDASAGSSWLQTKGLAPDPSLAWFDRKGRSWQAFALPPDQLEALRSEASAQGYLLEPLQPSRLQAKPWLDTQDKGKALALWGSQMTEAESHFLGASLRDFLMMAGMMTGRATFYNTKEEQEAYEDKLHQRLFSISRGLYALCALLPGLTDRSLQTIFFRLLQTPRIDGAKELCSEAQEDAILLWLTSLLPAPRLLKLFLSLRSARINNARLRKFLLRSILSQAKLELWAVRYRRKLRMILEHALSKRTCGILRSILERPASERTDKEKALLGRTILRFCPSSRKDRALACLAFLLQAKPTGDAKDAKDAKDAPRQFPLLRAYEEAKTDLQKGERLPFETLEGLRSTYHKDRSSAEVLELTKKQLTKGQKLGLQRKAQESQVTLEVDFSAYDPVRLYLYAYERGMTPALEGILQDKARATAETLPTTFGFRHIGILLDASASMSGHETQPLRPIAAALALRDLLTCASSRTTEVVCGGRPRSGQDARLIDPEGDSSLAAGFLELLRAQPDAIFLLSDGYENTPAGRLAEVILAARRLGFSCPIYQMTPVLATETQGLRALAPGLAPTIPFSKPESLGLSILSALFVTDPLQGLFGVLELASERLASLPLLLREEAST